jgi:peptidoglycan/LPS O-acetylase OafA/YrhL
LHTQVPETVSSKIDRVYWIDVLRIIACLIVPIVHAKNYTGTYGLESERHPGFWFCGYDANDPAQVCLA